MSYAERFDQFEERGDCQASRQLGRHVPTTCLAAFPRKTCRINAIVCGRLFKYLVQRDGCDPSGCRDLVLELRTFHRTLDPLDELLIAEESTFDSLRQRIFGRRSDPGRDKSSVSRLWMCSAHFPLPGPMDIVVSEPRDPFAFESIARVTRPHPLLRAFDQWALSADRIKVNITTHVPKITFVFNQFSLKSSLKQMSRPTVAGIEPVGITREQVRRPS